MAIKYFFARLIRTQSTPVYFSLSLALLHSVNARIPGADFFEEQQPQACQVYTIVESPIVLSTFVPSNTVLSNPACGCEITVSNAPRFVLTTLTMTTTLGANPIATPSTNPRFPAGTSISSDPTFYISIDDTQNQKRHAQHEGKFLTRDGDLTSDPSQAVKVFESSGRLYTKIGATRGTYFTDANVGFMTFASKSTSSITPNSIAGYFKLGSRLVWNHKLFYNSTAIFGLSAEGLVQAIFDGKVPAGTKVISLVLTRVASKNTTSSISGGPGNGGTTVSGVSSILNMASLPINRIPPAITLAIPSSLSLGLSSGDGTALTIPAPSSFLIPIAELAVSTEISGGTTSIPATSSPISSFPTTNKPASSFEVDPTSSSNPSSSTPTISSSPVSSSPTSEKLSHKRSSGADFTSILVPSSSIPATPSSLTSTSQIAEASSSTISGEPTSLPLPPSSLLTATASPVSSSSIAEASSPTLLPTAAFPSPSLPPSRIATTISSLISATEQTSPTLQPSCKPLSPSPSSIPSALGRATLATPPDSNTTYTWLSTAFSLTFPTPLTPALAELNPTTPPRDSILYYQLPLSLTTSTPTCLSWGYLYHQQSGLCLTAQSTSRSSPMYEGGKMVLEPCAVCEALPQEDQLFCAVQEHGSLGKWFCVGFMGDDASGVGYGVLYETGAVDAVLEDGGGDCIYVPSF